MTPEINVDLSQTIPYFVDRFLGLIGQDSATKDTRLWLSGLWKTAWLESSYVLCIGMHDPIPIKNIYQPTRLMRGRSEDAIWGLDRSVKLESVPRQQLATGDVSAIIKAGPGWGKTTFLSALFVEAAVSSNIMPFLFVLRHSTAVKDMEEFVELLSRDDEKIRKLAEKISKSNKHPKILLLVDGYDEVSDENRKLVSETLLKFSAKKLGNFLLTCRSFYDVYDLKVPTLHLAGFDHQDQIGFVTALTKALACQLDANEIITELTDRGFSDFLSHPLLLALVCIVKSGPISPISNSVMGLIERAIDTLSFRWDLAKGIARETLTPLDGKQRIQCLMRLAYELPLERAVDHRVYPIVDKQLELWKWENLDSRKILLEIARFYGVFVQTSTGWAFVHRTLQDYLAAKYWVESANFRPGRVGEWNTRAAYAACLSTDATPSMEFALRKQSISAFAEMLMNDPPFYPEPVARALVEYWNTRQPQRSDRNGGNIVSENPEYLNRVSTKFLIATVAECLNWNTVGSDKLLACSMVLLSRRSQRLPTGLFERCKTAFGIATFKFSIMVNDDPVSTELSNLSPKIFET